MAGPFPDLRFCPTGGLTPSTFTDYLALNNVFCVGGTWMVKYTDGQPDVQAIEDISRATLTTLAAAIG